MNDLVIDVRNLCKSFGPRKVVDGLSLQVAAGEICGFLGANGSGKTTTIRMLCGLLTPDAGEGKCLGFDVVHDAQLIRREAGYMTQHFGFYDDLTVFENLDFVAAVYEMPDRQDAVADIMARMGLAERAGQLAGQLSGGWKQRLALGACTLPNPSLLLLDEPTAGVDPKARRDFWSQIHELAAGGLTVLVSTHYMDEAERCHEIAYIAFGEVLTRGTVDEVIANAHLSTFTVGATNGENLSRLAGELTGSPGIDMVAPFGNSLHVSGRDAPALDAAIAPYRQQPGLVWQRALPSLEDVFIDLMGHAKDNFQ
jgi:ABC-2 type transport system ATP-binding protein